MFIICLSDISSFTTYVSIIIYLSDIIGLTIPAYLSIMICLFLSIRYQLSDNLPTYLYLYILVSIRYQLSDYLPTDL